MRRRTILAPAGLALAGGLALPGLARAQAWPTRPVRLITPDAPGGGGDILARVLSQFWGLGQALVVENRAGAGGRIGVEAAWRSPPDGSTLLLGNAGSNGVNAAIYRDLPYDLETGFTPISLIAFGPNVLAINPRVFAARDVAALIAALKAAPGRFNYASAGAGSSAHFSMELFKLLAGVQVEHVPYRGAPAMAQAAVGGDAPLLIANLSNIMPVLQRGELLPLAVTSARRWPDLPQLPTLQEAGLPGFETIAWNGLFGPPGLPPEIVARAQAEIARIATLPEARERVRALGVEVVASTPEVLAQRVRTDIARWKDLVARTGISAE
jgi:tripartite-type tricarboxylate transporter receptor subunit TctC